jgi:hypothetical protein
LMRSRHILRIRRRILTGLSGWANLTAVGRERPSRHRRPG